MKAFKTVSNPEAFQLMADETRRRIIYLLRAKEMTVAQLAEALSLTPQAVYHHIRRLREADLVEVAKEERVDHFIETYFRASAEMFHFTMGKGQPSAVVETQELEALRNLPRIGLNIREDPAVVSKLVDLQRHLKGQEEGEAKWLDKIGDLEDVDFLTKQSMEHYATLLGMTDDEFDRYCNSFREQRELLRSLLVAAPVVKVKGRGKRS